MSASKRPGRQKRAAGTARRGAAWRVVALAAGILLAGSLGTYFAARAIAAPAAAVEQSAALPVYNAVGQTAGEIQFLPWQVFDEGTPELMGEITSREVMAGYAQPVMALLSCGHTRQAGWEPLNGAFSIPFYSAADRRGNFTYIEEAPFMVSCQPGPEALPATFPALLDIASGFSPGDLPTAYFTMQLRSDLLVSSSAEQMGAARSAVLQDLYALTAMEGTDPAYSTSFGSESAQPEQAGAVCGLQALLPLLENYLAQQGISGQSTVALSFVRDALEDPNFSQVFREVLETADPQATGDARIEQALQAAFSKWNGIDFQLVTLDSTVLLLFTTSYDAGSALGVYYDPVLGCYSGFGIQ